MSEQTEAQRLSDELVALHGYPLSIKAAAELRRLDEAHDWQHKMAGDRLRRIEKLERTNAQLLETLKDIAYQLEKARIWGGMDWHYNPLHPIHYLPARDKARAAIAAAKEQA
jgi:hypothetical protein